MLYVTRVEVTRYPYTFLINYCVYFIPCRPTYQRLVYDEQSSPNSSSMPYVRVYGEGRGSEINGEPQTYGIEEHTYSV